MSTLLDPSLADAKTFSHALIGFKVGYKAEEAG